MKWSEPRSLLEWLKRAFGLRPLLLSLIITGILISELRFDWIEQAIGAFLVTTNSRRPESGAIWEIDRRTATARRTIEQIVTDRQVSQREARDAKSFVQILPYLSPEQGVMLSPDHFRNLYLELPSAIAQEIVSPFEFLQALSDGRLSRIYLEKAGSALRIYFLDAENRVLRQLGVDPELLDQIIQNERSVDAVLEDYPKFQNRIYSASHFFRILTAEPEDVRRSAVPRVESLLKASGRLLRVGISDEAVFGFIELGFEIEVDTRKKVVFMPGREWAVWQIRLTLEAKKTKLNFLPEP